MDSTGVPQRSRNFSFTLSMVVCISWPPTKHPHSYFNTEIWRIELLSSDDLMPSHICSRRRPSQNDHQTMKLETLQTLTLREGGKKKAKREIDSWFWILRPSRRQTCTYKNYLHGDRSESQWNVAWDWSAWHGEARYPLPGSAYSASEHNSSKHPALQPWFLSFEKKKKKKTGLRFTCAAWMRKKAWNKRYK